MSGSDVFSKGIKFLVAPDNFSLLGFKKVIKITDEARGDIDFDKLIDIGKKKGAVAILTIKNASTEAILVSFGNESPKILPVKNLQERSKEYFK